MYEEEMEEPKSSFVTYLSEGDKLCNAGDYEKALDSYNTALQIEEKNRIALVARSHCHLLAGDNEASLQDAEKSLKEDENFHKGLYQKAEALYQMGDFEQALVYYHRGFHLRPELQEFHFGIQKSKEAINNCVGSPSSVKLENKGDLSFFNKMDEAKLKARGRYRLAEGLAASRNARTSNSNTSSNNRATKTLLGELYAEKKFLEKLLRDEALVKENQKGINIYDLVTSGIQYLDTRTEFWRQQKPLYAHKRDRMLLEEQWNKNKWRSMMDPTSFILKNLEQIDTHLADGKGAESLSLALSTLRAVSKLSDKEMPNKADVLGNLHSCIGNAHLDLGQTDDALIHHQKDLDIAKQHNLQDARSRALDNLGRAHAKIGNYQKAIDCWEEKLPLSKSDIENTWLYHEIGRCHLMLGAFDKARECGKKSLEESKKAEDDVWKLNAGVLIAQAEVKLEMFDEAVRSFTECLETAKLQEDAPAEVAITKALEELQEKMQMSQNKTSITDKEAEDVNAESNEQQTVVE